MSQGALTRNADAGQLVTNLGAVVAGPYVLAFVGDARRISFASDSGVDSEDVRWCPRPDTLHDAGCRSGDESFQVRPVRHSPNSAVLTARESEDTDGL